MKAVTVAVFAKGDLSVLLMLVVVVTVDIDMVVIGCSFVSFFLFALGGRLVD